MSETTDLYWDCDCENNYIHKKTDMTYCEICDAEEKDSPDSQLTEVILMLSEIIMGNTTNGDAFIQDAEQDLKILKESIK
jgi:hypothetical protein